MANYQAVGNIPLLNSGAQYYDPSALGDLAAQQQQLQQRQQLAQAFMTQPYVKNSGVGGVLSSALGGLVGGILQKRNDAKVSDLVREQIEAQNQAAQAQRAQQIQDEQRKMAEAIFQANSINTNKAQAAKQYALPTAVGGGAYIMDPSTGQLTANPDFNANAIALATGKANAEAAASARYRQGPADPFADIKQALAQGAITPAQAQQAIAAKAMGSGGGLSPKDQQAVNARLPKLQDNLNKIDDAIGIAKQMKDELAAGTLKPGGLAGYYNALAPAFAQTTAGQNMTTEAGNLVLAAQGALTGGAGTRSSVAQLKVLQSSKPSNSLTTQANTDAVNNILKVLQHARSQPAAEAAFYGQGGTPMQWAQQAAQMAAQGQQGASGSSPPPPQGAQPMSDAELLQKYGGG